MSEIRTPGPLDDQIGRYIWEERYRWCREGQPVDQTIDDTWMRIAAAAAQVEVRPDEWHERFLSILRDFKFLPGGRILAGAGTDLNVTLFNCFVMGIIKDDMSGIFDSLREGALTMQAGGGVGYDFSTLRPKGTVARSTANIASGPVSYMHVWNAMCETLLSTGARRGAMIATLRCDHPDVLQFIAAKEDSRALNHFNLSVLVTDEFMRCIDAGADWPLVFPQDAVGHGGSQETLVRAWPGYDKPVHCKVMARLPARELWRRIMETNYTSAEPGVLFIDRINDWNNLAWREQITCTNPCGEIPLPPYGACDLGSINLTRFVIEPFSPHARFDHAAIAAVATVATRFLDDVIDISRFPLAEQRNVAHGSRRIGLGITGLADALIMTGLNYGSSAARRAAARLMQTVCHAAYRASVSLAAEKGSFPFFDRDAFLAGRFVGTLPPGITSAIARDGIRNSHLNAIAPTGTISLLAGNISSGIEPVFDFKISRQVLDRRSHTRCFDLEDYAYRSWCQRGGAALPATFVSAQTLDPRDQLAMQAALQPYVDNAISKTVNVPAEYSFEQFEHLYRLAWQEGLKGCTTYRRGSRSGEVLASGDERAAALDRCCVLE